MSNQKSFQLVLALTIFLGAFLLFFIQPLVARQLLPKFGGAASVWIACLLSFQTLLLLGYCYAHLLRLYFSPRLQCLIHFPLLALCLPWTWINWFAGSGVINLDAPLLSVTLVLSSSIGLPFVLASATSPLVQHWYGLQNTQPYRLYALSNLGSLLALLSYPFVVEPQFTITDQFRGWMTGLVVYLILGIVISWNLLPLTKKPSRVGVFEATRQLRFYWTALSACGAMMLLTTSNALSREVAPIPLLWILPLATYLLTFVLCFDKPAWYHRATFFALFGTSVLSLTFVLLTDLTVALPIQIFTYLMVLFTACMICHGEMFGLRPDNRFLTEFYLFLSVGGVMGAVLVNILAPYLFTEYYEYEVTIVLTMLLGSHVAIKALARNIILFRVLAGSLTTVVAVAFAGVFGAFNDDPLWEELAGYRNFYGVLKVLEGASGEPGAHRKLLNDDITHGSQLTDSQYRHIPITYFSYVSGVGLTLIHHQKPRRQVAVIGLGAGTLAAYGNPGDQFRFYEINPDVKDIANRYFTYLKDSKAHVVVVDGDARLSLQTDLRQGRRFDVLIIDAFSGDAIPTHLLTEEAWSLYWQLLNKDGVLAVHLSNKYLNLEPVVRYHNEKQGRTELIQIDNEDDPTWDITSASWLIQTANRDFLRSMASEAKISVTIPATKIPPVHWTDEKSFVIGLFDF